MNNYIEFSEKGDSFSFVFSDNSDSILCCSKERGLKIVLELSDNKRITTSEYTKFRNQIMKAKNLPWCEPEEKAPVFDQGFLTQIKQLIPDFSYEEESEGFIDFLMNPHRKACLKMSSSKNCGRIFFKSSCTPKFDRKIEAFSCLVVLKKENQISEEDFLSIQKEIDQSTLR
ncbi:MAG: hypothetical protein EOM85_01725 [Candidatus Moranbacteria bacterium]|nr:hypothetical protein [Candidatus Moranbacteria bacterium]